jgi:predicted RNase H-like HicB family nuclease
MDEMTTAFNIHAVLFEEGEWWCAQCLEHDITAQAKTLPELRYELDRVLIAHICASLQEGRRPFEGLRRAPQKFWKMYESADLTLLAEGEDNLACRTSAPMDFPPVIAKMKVAELSGDLH